MLLSWHDIPASILPEATITTRATIRTIHGASQPPSYDIPANRWFAIRRVKRDIEHHALIRVVNAIELGQVRQAEKIELESRMPAELESDA